MAERRPNSDPLPTAPQGTSGSGSGPLRSGAPSSETARPADRPPARVGPYVLESELGRGGMGVVHRAFDERLHRHVALKALPSTLFASPEGRARFEREARALARVNHPNVATIFGIESADDGMVLLVLEHIEGEDLAARTARGALALPEALALGREIAAGLAAVHRAGLVHRDLKPANVMITTEGRAKLLDFGLARALEPATSASPGDAARDAERTTEVIGTPGFMSPEQLAGDPLDERSDVFAWGCVLFECLTGQRAFDGPDSGARSAATLTREPDWSLLPAGLDTRVRDLLVACLTKDPAGRPGSAIAITRALDACVTGSLPRATAGPGAPVHHLPARADTFVGRDAELAELGDLLHGSDQIVTVVGPGGTGKTRLVSRLVGAQVPTGLSGAWFCDLSSARSLDGILSVMAGVLMLRLDADPADQVGRAIEARGAALFVLDNFEQVATLATDTVGRWAAQAPRARFLVTSRQPLHVTGERVMRLAPLPVASSGVELFVARARQHRPGFALGEGDADRIRRIVEMLDGLPLAIELAAARVRVLSPEGLLERMGDRFRVLAGGSGTNARQATMQAALQWSWDLLEPWERATLQRLSIFESPFDVAAAETVMDLGAWPDAPWPLDVLQALVDKSLVRTTIPDRLGLAPGSGEPMFRLFQLVREFARDSLAAATKAERSAVEARHGAAMRSLAEEATTGLVGHQGVAWRAEVGLRLDDLIAACRLGAARGDAPTVIATLTATADVLHTRGSHASAAALAAEAAATPGLDAAARAIILRIQGDALGASGLGLEARALLERSLDAARETGDDLLRAESLHALARWEIEDDLDDQGEARLREALAIAGSLNAPRIEALARAALGLLNWRRGHSDRARPELERAVAMFRQAGDRLREGNTLANLALACDADSAKALAMFAEALAIHREVGNRRSEAVVLGNMAIEAGSLGRRSEARELQSASLVIAREIGNDRLAVSALNNLALDHAETGQPDIARDLYAQAGALAARTRSPSLIALVKGNLGLLHQELGDVAPAREFHAAALALHRELGDRRSAGIDLANMGDLEASEGHVEEARALLLEARALAIETENTTFIANTAVSLAWLDAEAGKWDDARQALESAVEQAHAGGLVLWEGIARARLASVLCHVGRQEEGLALFDVAIALLREDQSPRQLADALILQARATHAAGDSRTAGRCLAEAEALAVATGTGPGAPLARALAGLREQLARTPGISPG